VEHEAEWRKLVARGSDYDELLRLGFVNTRVDDAAAWRAEIRANARADRIRVGTFGSQETASVYAYLKRERDDEEMLEKLQAAMNGMAAFEQQAIAPPSSATP
jgi:hypothetical protein